MSRPLSQWFPENVSTYGGDIDGLFYLIFWIVGVWFVLTEVAMLYFVIRYRRRPGAAARHVAGETATQAAWVLVPAFVVLLLDLAIDFAGGRVWATVKEEIPTSAAEVRVVAKQFNWEFAYPGPDGRFGTADDRALDNDLYVPVNTDIRARLESKDVLHSFFLPNVRLKQDVVPGRGIDVWFNVTKAGIYEIACAELCGFGHYTMRGRLVALAPAEYRAWVEKQWPRS
jgi:cytochrome c oxidase subunit 2